MSKQNGLTVDHRRSRPHAGRFAEAFGTAAPSWLVSAPIAIAALLAAPAMLTSPASAELVTIRCGAPAGNIVKQQFNRPFSTNSASFVDVPGASARIDVPAGQKRCVTVQFFASASCKPSPNGDECYVRVVDVGSNPATFPPAVTLLSRQTTPAAHGYAFTAVLGAGSHTLKVQVATEGGASSDLANWQSNYGVGG